MELCLRALRKRVIWLCAAILLFALTSTAKDVLAQAASGPTADPGILQRLVERVEKLEAKTEGMNSELNTLRAENTAMKAELQTLRAARNSVPETVHPAATAVAKQEDGDNQEFHTTHDGISPGLPRLEIRGFADVGYRVSDRRGYSNSFNLGQLDLFITSRLDEKFSVLSEVVFGGYDGNSLQASVERLLLQYSPSDYFNVAVGRYHSAIGYYNTAYHHGTWFETAVTRPTVFAFERQGGILPIHNVGITAHGRIPSGSMRLHYEVELGNGRGVGTNHDTPVQAFDDENKSKAINVGIISKPDWAPGLQTGFSIYHDRLSPIRTPAIGQTIMAAHAVFQNPKLELLNEVVLINNSQEDRRTSHTTGFYTQVSRQFGRVRPYFRYNYLNAPATDPLFHDVGRSSGPSFGLRYNFSDFAAFKSQYEYTQRRGLEVIKALSLQLAFTF